jgi:hypothetical protein
MRGMAEGTELAGGLVQRIEIVKELLSVSSSLGTLPLVLSWVSMKYFTVVLLAK